MNQFGFANLPTLSATIQAELPGIERHQIAGLDHRWQMPCAVYEAPSGFDATVHDQRDHHTLAFMTTGNTVVERVDGRFRGLKATSRHLTLHHEGETHRYRTDERVRFAHVYFRSSLLEHLSETTGVKPRSLTELRDDRVAFLDGALLTDLQIYVARACAQDAPPSSLEMDARSLVISLALLQRHSAGAFKVRTVKGGLAPWQLKRVCDAMTAHLGQDVNLAWLAELVGLSPTHLCRAFKQSTGRPPFEWLLHRRIDMAQAMLRDTRHTLAEIALAVGFSAQPQFTTAFKRVTGVTPGAWRRERLT